MTDQIDKLKKVLADDRAHAIRRALATPDGAILLDALSQFADGDLIGHTTETTYANLGAREVVMYLRRLVRLSESVESKERSQRQGR